MIISHQDQDAAVGAGACKIAVPKRITRPIHPWTLGVPHRENPVVKAVASPSRLLGSPDRRRCKVLINGGQKLDVAGFKLGLGQCQLLIQCAQRRASISGHVPCCAHAGPTIYIALHHGQTHQRLYPGHENLI